MGGRMSRNKGARSERSLVMHLRLLGYDARRVIRTRAVKGYGADNVVDVEILENGEVRYTFEAKARAHDFKTIYALYDKCKVGNVHRIALPGGPLIALGTDFEEVKKTSDVHFKNLSLDGSETTRTHMKLVRLRGLLKGAQFLVLKGNNKPFLFVRYWS